MAGGGAAGALIRATDWSRTPLGAAAGWPQALRSALSICLNSAAMSAVYWGPDFRMFYNDTYALALEDRHPAALGAALKDIWTEYAPALTPQLERVVRTGQGFVAQDQSLFMTRDGRREETFWTYSFAPIRDESDAVVGIFVSALENTAQVRAQRAQAVERQRLEQMFGQAPGFMAMLRGPEHRIEMGNAAYVTLVGGGDVMGRTVAEVLPSAVEQGFVAQLDDVYRTGKAFTAVGARYVWETEGDAPDIEQILDFVFQPIAGPGGVIEGIFVGGVDVSARARSEAALRDSEAFSRLLLDSSSEAFYSIDGKGVTTLCNNAFLTMLGFDSVEEVVGRRLHNVIHHSHADGSPYDPAACPIYRAAAMGESARVADELFFRKDGSPVPVEYRAEPLIRDGVLEGAICTFLDITDRKAAEAALRQSEAQLQTVARAMPNHVWTARADGYLDWFNERVYEYSGLREGELVGDGWASIVHPDDIGEAARNWRNALGSGARYEAQFRLRGADGSYRWHIARAVPVHDAAGAITRWIGTNTDIEDQKAAANALANQNETLEQRVAERTAERNRVWRNSQDMLVVADREGNILAINAAWTRQLGWESPDLVGRTFSDLAHPDDLQGVLKAAGRITETPDPAPYEYRVRHKDGGYRWISWTGALEDERIYANGRDVTVARAQAQALADSQEALRQAQKMEAVGQLTGGIAHDFNNMLAIVMGNLDIAGRRIGRGDIDIGKYLANAQEGASRAAMLTERLLAFSRQSPLAPRVVNLNSLVANISEMLRRTLGERILFETVLAGGLWSAHVDPNQLENAILNLAVNARDAMADGGRLTLETANTHLDERYAAEEAGLAAGQYVMIAVTDVGEGMDAETLKKVFEPFFTTKPVGKGTGLGLSMVYGFAKQSGGHVRLYSEPGRGTTVKLYLPRYFGSAAEVREAAPARSIPTAATDGEIILVVEDEERVRSMTCDALQELGYRVHQASSGEQALDMFGQLDHVDLVFTDVVMPGISGRQLADALRADHPGVKILFTTGYTRNAVVHNGVLDEGTELLSKPFTVQDLALKLRLMLDG